MSEKCRFARLPRSCQKDRWKSRKGFTQGYTAGIGPDGQPGDVATQAAPNCTFDTGPFVGLVPSRDYAGMSASGRFKELGLWWNSLCRRSFWRGVIWSNN